MSRIIRIDDGQREEVASRSTRDIQDDAEMIDLEEEIHKTKTTSEDIRWNQTGRYIFERMIQTMQ